MTHTTTTEAAKARFLAAKALNLANALERGGDRYTTRAMYELLALCNATIDLIDDGDCMGQRDTLMEELRCDESGNPVNENWEPIGDYISFGMHHPDSPSWGASK